MTPRIFLFSSLIAFVGVTSARAQEQAPETAETAYIRVVNERAAKIVATLELTDPAKSARVQEIITRQYRDLNAIQEHRKEALKNRNETASKEALEAEKTKVESETANALKKLHIDYLTRLENELDEPRIDRVKDGMTYGVLPITYKGYQAMLPDLTDEQKKQVLTWLTEARERAMDEGSSKEKHALFGKYKGRINNYLSAAGIDMKKASKAWEERIAREAEKSKR